MTTDARATSMPRRDTAVRLKTKGASHMLLTEQGTKVLLLNETALALWELCDGETTLGEMVAAITDFFEAEPAVINHDVEVALAQMVEAGVVRWS